MTRQEQYDRLKARILERYPDTKIKYKCDHWLWKRLPDIFSKRTATTNPLTKTIWMQDRKPRLRTLAHEYQHIVDINDMGGIAFSLMYLSPQSRCLLPLVLCILACGFTAWAWAIVMAAAAVFCLLPWPSKGRAYLELRGYMMGVAISHWWGYDLEDRKRKTIDIMRSWLYYKMVWSSLKASELVHDAIENHLEDAQHISVAFKDVHEIVHAT
jgi:hypothetical protein